MTCNLRNITLYIPCHHQLLYNLTLDFKHPNFYFFFFFCFCINHILSSLVPKESHSVPAPVKGQPFLSLCWRPQELPSVDILSFCIVKFYLSTGIFSLQNCSRVSLLKTKTKQTKISFRPHFNSCFLQSNHSRHGWTGQKVEGWLGGELSRKDEDLSKKASNGCWREKKALKFTWWKKLEVNFDPKTTFLYSPFENPAPWIPNLCCWSLDFGVR